MKHLYTAACFCLMALFPLTEYAAAQITITSVLVTGRAIASGGGPIEFVDDSDMFSVNMFTDGISAFAHTGAEFDGRFLNSSFAEASAEFDGNSLTIETFSSASVFNEPTAAEARTFVEVAFRLDSSYDVFFLDDIPGFPIGDGFDGNPLAKNTFSRTDDQMIFYGIAEPFRIGPGNYLIRSESQAYDAFASNSSQFENFTRTEISFTPVPEPSSIALLAAACLTMASRRRRVANASV